MHGPFSGSPLIMIVVDPSFPSVPPARLRMPGRWFVNALAESADVVAASLVPRLRAVALGPDEEAPEPAGPSPVAAIKAAGDALARLQQGGRTAKAAPVRIAFLTPADAVGRMARRFVLGENKGCVLN